MIRRFIIIFCILFSFTMTIINSKRYTVQVDEVKLLNSTYLKGVYNFSRVSVTKYNRSTFVLNMEAELLTDFTEDYFIDIAYYLKRRAGLTWSKGPYNWPKRHLCDLLRILEKYTPNNTTI